MSRRRRLTYIAIGLLLLFLFFSLVAPLSRPLDPLKQPALILVSADGRPIARRGAYKDVPVKVGALPRHVGDAFVAIEDRRFYRHPGIDLRGVLRAAIANSRAGGVVQGGSTITQQLAKNAYLEHKRTLGRKLHEAVIAVWLELRMSKQEILSAYLSSVYFGDGVYGVTAAARHYFGKAPENLTLSEAAMLAGVVKAPSRLNPVDNPGGAGRRARLVLNAMTEAGLISEQEARSAGRVRLQLDRSSLPLGTYFADWVTPAARAAVTQDYGEATVRTTLDYSLQLVAEDVVRRHMARHPGKQVAVVAMTPAGAVLAMVGGRSYGQSQFNRATQAKRQPGSAFKPFVYLAAIRQGHSPDEMVDDVAITKGKWKPANFNGDYDGRISLRQAFAKSSNVVAVRLTREVGPRNVIRAAQDLGVTSKLQRDPTLALGTSETTLLELTSAYAAIASGYGPIRPFGVPRPADSTNPRRLDVNERLALLDLLSAAVSNGTGHQAALAIPAYGKTGTTQGNRDALFVGFIDGLVVGVWVGRDDHKPMPGVTGSGLPAEIWRDLMGELGIPAARTAISLAQMDTTPVAQRAEPRRDRWRGDRKERKDRKAARKEWKKARKDRD